MDLVGEKLNAAHVQSVLDKTFKEFAMTPTFVEVVPRVKPHRGYEVLIADSGLSAGQVDRRTLIQALEAGLCENPGYAYARSINQLHAIEVKCLGNEEAKERAMGTVGTALAGGFRLGDIKPKTLSSIDVASTSAGSLNSNSQR